MDVTSLLNSSAAAKMGQMMQQRGESLDLTPTPSVVSNTTAASTGVATPPPEKSPSRSNSESRTPNRSRTPWDAGGYSLPLTLDTKLIRTPLPAKPALYGESPTADHHMDTGSPSSPKHKFSDSRSSLSSAYTTASSNNSGSHSRISSLSTVSEFQPMNNLITEFSSLEAKISDENDRQGIMSNSGHQSTNSASSGIIPGDALAARSGTTGLDGSGDGSLTGSAGVGGGMVEARMQPLSPYSMNNSTVEVHAGSVTNNSSESESSSERPDQRSDRASSPSDAILFTSNATSTREQLAEVGRRSLEPFGYQPGHKRAVSAPDFPAVRTRYQPSVGFAAPIVEPPYSPTGFYSQSFSMADQGQRRPSLVSEDDPYPEDPTSSATQSDQTVHPGTAAMASGNIQDWDEAGDDVNDTAALAMDDDALCEASDYEEDACPRCLWGNQPCDTGSQLRKAVSHIFGRNKLCTRQIPDPAWVHFCRKHYQRARYRLGPNYSLTQVRLVIRQINKIKKWSDYNAAHGRSSGVVSSWRIQLRKREEKRQETKQQGKKRTRDDDLVGLEDMKSEPPEWLISKVGDGYSTEDVLSIAWQLKDDLINKRYARIPDVEILPNITSDRAEEAKPRAKPQRRAAPAGQPTRSQGTRSRMAPYGYPGHRSTLSESARSGSHLDHMQDVVAHWDSPSKRQRAEYGGQMRQGGGWFTSQAPTQLPLRPNDMGAYGASLNGASQTMGSGAGTYSYGLNMQQQPQQRQDYAMSQAAWAPAVTANSGRMGASSYAGSTMHSTYAQTASPGQQQQQPHYSTTYGGANTAQQQQPQQQQQQQQQAYFSGSPYGGSGAQQSPAQQQQQRTSSLYDTWGGYNPNSTSYAAAAAAAQGRGPSQQQTAASGIRSHQRHVSAPWPNSGLMGTSYQFAGAGAAVPQFSAAPMDPALLGQQPQQQHQHQQHQRRSSLPHGGQMVAGSSGVLSTTPQMQQQSPMGGGVSSQASTHGGGEHDASAGGYDRSIMAAQRQPQQYDPNPAAGRYDFGPRR